MICCSPVSDANVLSSSIVSLRFDVKRLKKLSVEQDRQKLEKMYPSMEAGEEMWFVRFLPITYGYPKESGGEADWEKASVSEEAVASRNEFHDELSMLFESMVAKEQWVPSLDTIVCSALGSGVIETSIAPLLQAGVITGRWSSFQASQIARNMKEKMEREISLALLRRDTSERGVTTAMRSMVRDLSVFVVGLKG